MQAVHAWNLDSSTRVSPLQSMCRWIMERRPCAVRAVPNKHFSRDHLGKKLAWRLHRLPERYAEFTRQYRSGSLL